MKEKIKNYFLLHIALMVYTFSSIFSKKAASTAFLSSRFWLFYAGAIIILGIYAIAWQQIIKRMSLTTAFSNKAITVVWGIIWGALFFHEQITLGKILGAIFVILGVVLYVHADSEECDDD